MIHHKQNICRSLVWSIQIWIKCFCVQVIIWAWLKSSPFHLCLTFRSQVADSFRRRRKKRRLSFFRGFGIECRLKCFNRLGSGSLLNSFAQFCGLCPRLGPLSPGSSGVQRKLQYWQQSKWALLQQQWYLAALPWLKDRLGIDKHSNACFLSWQTHLFWYIWLFFRP